MNFYFQVISLGVYYTDCTVLPQSALLIIMLILRINTDATASVFENGLSVDSEWCQYETEMTIFLYFKVLLYVYKECMEISQIKIILYNYITFKLYKEL